MDLDQFPLRMFEVDCDGSACGSPRRLGLHVHRAQVAEPLGGVVVRDGVRVRYVDVADAAVRVNAFLNYEHVVGRPGMWRLIAEKLPPLEDD